MAMNLVTVFKMIEPAADFSTQNKGMKVSPEDLTEFNCLMVGFKQYPMLLMKLAIILKFHTKDRLIFLTQNQLLMILKLLFNYLFGAFLLISLITKSN